MNTPSRDEVQVIKAIHGAKGVGKHTGAYTCHNCKGNDAVFRKVISRGGGKIITNHCVRCNTRVQYQNTIFIYHLIQRKVLKFNSDAHRKAVHAHMKTLKRKPIDHIASDEIVLTMENDGDFYRKTLYPIQQQMEKRMNKPRGFNSDYALAKMSQRVGTEATQRYYKEHGTTPNDWKSIDTSTREKIGRDLLKDKIQSAREEIMYRGKK